MKKKLFLTLFITIFLCTLFSLSSNALSINRPYSTENKNIKIVNHVVYKLTKTKNDTYYTVIDYFDTNENAATATEINLASEIDGIPVTSICTGTDWGFGGPAEFEDYPNISEITVPDTVKYVSDASFSGFSSIETIELPEGVESIGDAFYSMDNLRTVTLPEGVTLISDYAFSNCEKLEEIVIKGKITKIGDFSFSNCKNLKSINLPDTVKEIGEYAFNGSGLECILLPTGSLGEGAFGNCKNLKKLVIDAKNSPYISFDSNFSGCESLEKIYILSGGEKDIFLEPYAFSDCNKITDVYYWGSPQKLEPVFKAVPGTGWIDYSIKDNEAFYFANIHYYYNHTHSFTLSEKAATCKATGTKTYSCICGDTETVTTPKTDHSYGKWTVSKKPTEKADGTIKRTCSACKKAETKAVKYGFIPGATNSLTATSESDSVELTWKAVSGATGYRIYRYDYRTGNFIKLGNTENTEYTVKFLYPDKLVKYAVKAYTQIDGKTYWSKKYKAIETATIPKTPKLSVKTGKHGDCLLSFSSVSYDTSYDKPTNPAETKYIIYRSTDKNGNYQKIAVVSNKSYQVKLHSATGKAYFYSEAIVFKNTKLKADTYYYKVRACITAGGKNICSPYSNIVSFTVK